MDNTVIRSGDSGDTDTLLRFFDEAVEWLVARGSAKQWGTEPWSRVPKRIERVKGMAADPGLRIAVVDGEAAGALIVSEEHDPHVNPLGIKGVGEIGITGTAGAIANAVYHATGIRVRKTPITLDRLLG